MPPNESIEIFRESGKKIETIISIGGGAKNDAWLQIQADVFNATIVKVSSEQGPADDQVTIEHAF